VSGGLRETVLRVVSEGAQAAQACGWEGGLAPTSLECHSTRRGQATLPDHETSALECSFSNSAAGHIGTYDEQSRKHQRQEKEKEEEDCPRDLQGPEGVLDYPNSILAVGERGRGYQNRR